MICTAVTAFDDVIDDQPAADTAARRSTVPRYAFVAIPNEHMCPQPFPSLSAIEGIMHCLPLVRSGRPARWSEGWWFGRHILKSQVDDVIYLRSTWFTASHAALICSYFSYRYLAARRAAFKRRPVNAP